MKKNCCTRKYSTVD